MLLLIRAATRKHTDMGQNLRGAKVHLGEQKYTKINNNSENIRGIEG